MYKITYSIILLSSICMKASSQVVLNGLKAYYTFSGNANDVSGNNKNAFISGATLTTDRYGKASRAYQFSKTSSNYIRLPEAFDMAQRTISLMFYVESSNATTMGYVYCSDNSSLTNGNVAISILKDGNGNTQVLLQVADSYPPTNGTEIAKTITLQTWHTATIINDADSATFYLDCVKLAKFKNSKLKSGDGDPYAYLGAARLANNQFFDGKIDEVRIYNRALSETELDSICQYNITDGITQTQPESNPLLVYPNPGDGIFYIRGLNGENHLSIFSAEGKLVYETYLSEEGKIDMSGFANGVYIFEIQNKGYITRKKIILER